GDQLVDLCGGQAGQHLACLVHQPGNIGQQHQLLGAQRLGHLAGDQVGVDVVGSAVVTHADGRDYRNVVIGNQSVDQLHIDLADFTDLPHIDDLRLVHARGAAGDLELARA